METNTDHTSGPAGLSSNDLRNQPERTGPQDESQILHLVDELLKRYPPGHPDRYLVVNCLAALVLLPKNLRPLVDAVRFVHSDSIYPTPDLRLFLQGFRTRERAILGNR